VDLVLLEVGIGGLLDTTNVVTGEIAVITSIGLDHQETLGNSLAAIAEQLFRVTANSSARCV